MSSSPSPVGSSNSSEELAWAQPNRRRQRLSLRGSDPHHGHDAQQGQISPPNSTNQRRPVDDVEPESSRTPGYASAEGHTWPEFLRDHTTAALMNEHVVEPRPMDQSGAEGKRGYTSGRVRTTSGGVSRPDGRALAAAQLQGSSSTDLSQAHRREPATDSSSRRSTGERSLRAPSPVHRPSITMRRPVSTTQEVVLPRWQPDSGVSECPICSRQFTFWFRKHHCRKCGRVVCAGCSPHRITIPRQFIVHPSESTNRTPTNVTRDATISESTSEAAPSPRPAASPSWTAPRRTSISGLGGGEEVRLCNPCVPDPQPSPQATMDLAEFLWPGAGGGEVRSPLERSQPPRSEHGDFRRRSLHGQHSPSEEARELRRQRGRRMMPDNDGLSTMQTRCDGISNESLPEYGHLHYPTVPNYSRRDVPPRYQVNQGPLLPPPGYSSPATGAASVPNYGQPLHTSPLDGRAGSYGHPPQRNALPVHVRYSSMDAITRPTSSMRNRPRVRSMLDADPGFRRFLDPLSSPQPSRPVASPRPRLAERDACPICRHALPPTGADGDETAREAHVMDCIAARDPSVPPSSPGSRRSLAQSPPPAPTRMLSFVASEKDCMGEDGASQECSICFVEYDVGDHMARLECLCKFHKSCIVRWFARKQECPVHKVA